jgi:hypothetical protein
MIACDWAAMLRLLRGSSDKMTGTDFDEFGREHNERYSAQ